jgi:hypothetical protein
MDATSYVGRLVMMISSPVRYTRFDSGMQQLSTQ